MSEVVILSFDVGIKNLAYCLFRFFKETEDFEIIDWNVLDIHTDDKDFDSRSHRLFEVTHNTFSGHLDKIDYVAIENQPVLKNPIMKSVQLMLYSFFKMSQFNQKQENEKNEEQNHCIKMIDFVNASCKVKYATTELCKKPGFVVPDIKEDLPRYRKTKETSVQYTKELLRVLEKDTQLEYFNKFKKKDDLADTLLQGLYFINKHKLYR